MLKFSHSTGFQIDPCSVCKKEVVYEYGLEQVNREPDPKGRFFINIKKRRK